MFDAIHDQPEARCEWCWLVRDTRTGAEVAYFRDEGLARAYVAWLNVERQGESLVSPPAAGPDVASATARVPPGR